MEDDLKEKEDDIWEKEIPQKKNFQVLSSGGQTNVFMLFNNK